MSVEELSHELILILTNGMASLLHCPSGECTEACARQTPWLFHHQAERFLPPYFFTGDRPEITSVSAKDVKYGETVVVSYKGTVTGAVIMTPAATTHLVGMWRLNNTPLRGEADLSWA